MDASENVGMLSSHMYQLASTDSETRTILTYSMMTYVNEHDLSLVYGSWLFQICRLRCIAVI